MSINALTLYGNKKVSRPNLAAIVMRGRKDLFRFGGYSIIDLELTIIALQYILEGEHCRMSLCCSTF
jgi:hypothetical protein